MAQQTDEFLSDYREVIEGAPRGRGKLKPEKVDEEDVTDSERLTEIGELSPKNVCFFTRPWSSTPTLSVRVYHRKGVLLIVFPLQRRAQQFVPATFILSL